MKDEKDMTVEELEKLEEEELEVDSSAFDVSEGVCKDCGEKLVRVVEDRNLLDGAITFHIVKLKCEKCGKEYLDLEQSDKYDFLLSLEKAVKGSKGLKVLAERLG
jgi:uncharacterized protein with PIN domain